MEISRHKNFQDEIFKGDVSDHSLFEVMNPWNTTFIKDHSESSFTKNEYSSYHQYHRDYTMEIVIGAISFIGIIVLLCILCSCCKRTRNRGQVLSPPPATVNTSATAPYPQQQYTVAAFPVTSTAAGCPTGAPYPAAPYPTGVAGYPMPAVSPHVTGGAHYPTGGAPYPTSGVPYPTVGAPYPTGGAPYPTGGAPYPTGGAPYHTGGDHYPNSTATAPNEHALPPTYDQAVGVNANIEKQPPFNPNAPY